MTNLESPKWFQDALEQKPESQSIEVDGANISYLTWGKKKTQEYYLFMVEWLMLIGGALLHLFLLKHTE